MLLKKNIRVLNSIAFLTFMVMCSCESTFKDVQKINFSEFSPSGEADSITLKYTDSGRITAVLISPKMLDYATVDYPFTEFPKGVDVTLYDVKGKRTFVKSNYAVRFVGTDILDLRQNVRISSEEGQLLQTEQLYYDQKNEWYNCSKPSSCIMTKKTNGFLQKKTLNLRIQKAVQLLEKELTSKEISKK